MLRVSTHNKLPLLCCSFTQTWSPFVFLVLSTHTSLKESLHSSPSWVFLPHVQFAMHQVSGTACYLLGRRTQCCRNPQTFLLFTFWGQKPGVPSCWACFYLMLHVQTSQHRLPNPRMLVSKTKQNRFCSSSEAFALVSRDSLSFWDQFCTVLISPQQPKCGSR